MEITGKKIEVIICSHDTGFHLSLFPSTDSMIPGFLKLTLS